VDTIGWFVATLHDRIGHDKTAALLEEPAGRVVMDVVPPALSALVEALDVWTHEFVEVDQLPGECGWSEDGCHWDCRLGWSHPVHRTAARVLTGAREDR
jgi:hypothetical protein